MAVSTRSEFVDFIVPLRGRLDLYDRTKPPSEQPRNDAADITKAIPQGFIDAMTVREEVFVKEQGIELENELDDDDCKSFHWVAYASIPAKNAPANAKTDPNMRRTSTSTKIPIGTIRLVLPPHAPHPTSDHRPHGSEQDNKTGMHDGKEAYVKLGRLAVIKEFRKAGISRLLIETALAFARDHPLDMMPFFDPTKIEALNQEHARGVGVDWRGLVLVHAQTGVQKIWKKYGFETDEGMGVWDEENIEHVGMWRRLDIHSGRRTSKAFLPIRP
ncbi:Hypothetical protein R9X50_00632700 [Acrodontium crateriforme]|uniref:N-acetyltransferase domain-containing protein n=1 Tax=Acrodontium crateriforme TaxID=150365 RepID=A0AAQ3M7Q2_9PEZI|nr:Hypothetical protein R9X50_00632700 [Acrodontium crateriforme]